MLTAAPSDIVNSQTSLKKLKVAVIAPDLSGGGMTRVFLLSSVLQRLGHQVELIGCLFGPKIYPDPPSNLPIHAVPGCNLPQFAGSIRQLLKSIQADLIYAVKPRATSFGIALLKKLYTNLPIMVDIDDWELSWLGGDRHKYQPTLRQLARDILRSDGALRSPEHRFYLELMEQLIPRADGVTVNTKFLINRFGGHYLPNGKDTALFDPQRFDPNLSRVKYGLADYRVLMFPGTPRPHKGVEDVLLALEELNQDDLRLVIVGGRKPDNYEDKLLQMGGKWIIKLPRYPMEQMAEVVSAAHIVVVPQRDNAIARAQFPLKLTDGMAMAKPILATRVGDIPEILGKTGFLVDPSSPSQIAAEIQWIFQHLNEANTRGLEARKRCVKHYSIDAMASLLSNVVAKL